MKQIPISMPDVTGKEREYLNDCIDSGWISSIGHYVRQFESDFAAFCHAHYGISTNSGTAALHLALSALGIGPGDEVIVPALTFAATANAVLYCGATPVFADCSEDSWNIDPENVIHLINNKTRAIIVVHLFGQPCQMNAFIKISEQYHIPLIEDCAQAHGAQCNGQPVGSFGKIACFSFYGNKLITTGEGGMCVTDNQDLRDHMCKLRDHGMDPGHNYWHSEIGFNYRLTNMQAAIGCAQLERFDSIVQKRKWIAQQYTRQLQHLPLTCPDWISDNGSVCWLYAILLQNRDMRDQLRVWLQQHHIDARPFFYPLTEMPPYQANTADHPQADLFSQTGLMLPTFHQMDVSTITSVCQCINHWFEQQ